MHSGLTRMEILKKLPNLKSNCFYYYCKAAGIKKIGERPNKLRPHITEFIYPADAVEKLKLFVKKVTR